MVIILASNLKDLSDKLWVKLRRDFPERKVSDEIVDAMIYLSKIAELNLRMDRAKEVEQRALETKMRNDMQRQITKTILTLLVISKDLNIDIWETLDQGVLDYFEWMSGYEVG